MLSNEVIQKEKDSLEKHLTGMLGIRDIRVDKFGGSQQSNRDLGSVVAVLAYDTQNKNADGANIHFSRISFRFYLFIPNADGVPSGTVAKDMYLLDIMGSMGYELGSEPFYNDSLQIQYTFNRTVTYIPTNILDGGVYNYGKSLYRSNE